jgi:hypothetical protein
VANDPSFGNPPKVRKENGGHRPKPLTEEEVLRRAVELIEQLRNADFIPEEFDEEVAAILSK